MPFVGQSYHKNNSKKQFINSRSMLERIWRFKNFNWTYEGVAIINPGYGGGRDLREVPKSVVTFYSGMKTLVGFLPGHQNFLPQIVLKSTTAWKVSRYGVFSGPYFPVFGLNTEIYVNLRSQSKYRKVRTMNNSVSGHFSHSVPVLKLVVIF